MNVYSVVATTIHRPLCSLTGGISHVIKELACALGK